MADTILTADRLREAIHYDPATGIFTRKIRLAQRHQIGDRADFLVSSGNLKGYHRVSLLSKRYLAHRLAWLYVHGEWPSNFIDHRNGVKSDNRIENIRDVVGAVNTQNIRVAKRSSKSGFLGVHWHEGSQKWRARVQLRNKAIEAGLHETPEQAHQAYLEAKRKHHEGCTI